MMYMFSDMVQRVSRLLPRRVPRRVLRTVFRGLGAAVVSVVFQACYGTPMDTGDDVAIQGVVKSKTTNRAIPGIKVGVAAMSSFDQTDSQGRFYLYAPKAERYELVFEDIDGAENGSFRGTSRVLDLAAVGTDLTVALEEAHAE